uniref:Uncharacterized protein n=1 Tax=Rangifer tarandus platyrhynchus TaxID=3082113 RepID=A0ACB0EBW5_RANTA|nr:unnamed protein product [Rangifer tarandus platyrhynchus]
MGEATRGAAPGRRRGTGYRDPTPTPLGLQSALPEATWLRPGLQRPPSLRPSSLLPSGLAWGPRGRQCPPLPRGPRRTGRARSQAPAPPGTRSSRFGARLRLLVPGPRLPPPSSGRDLTCEGPVRRNLEGHSRPGRPARSAPSFSSGSREPWLLVQFLLGLRTRGGPRPTPPLSPHPAGLPSTSLGSLSPTPAARPCHRVPSLPAPGTEASAPLGGHDGSPEGRRVPAQSSSACLGPRGLRQ